MNLAGTRVLVMGLGRFGGGVDDKQLERFFVQQAGVGLIPRIIFGEQGSGFMRMNIAAPRSVIAEALEKIARAERLRK